MVSKFRNSGQTCVCVNRFLVQAAVYETFIEKFKAAVERLKVGNGADEQTTQGPLINEAALAKVIDHVDDVVLKGGKIITGGTKKQRRCLFLRTDHIG